MGFEQMPQMSELDQLKADIEKTQAEILAMDPEAPEMEWLKEKLQSLDARQAQLEKPELRTPESYGQAPAKAPEVVEQAEKRLLDDQDHKAA